jgi:hypothetical protein
MEKIVKSKNVIGMYFHCKMCLEELPKTESPMSWSRTQCGWTSKGVQVWCIRHDTEIVHLDLLGQKISYA